MANFQRHVEFAALGSGMLSSVCLGANLATPYEALILWITGSLGGILPDIDSDNSSALDIVFSIVFLFCVFMILSSFREQYSTLTLWGVCLLAFGVIRWIIRPIFEGFTVHRGIFHSVVAGLFFAFATINLAFYFGHCTGTFSWLIGLFLMFGFLIHLLLDELYSVDLTNTRIKRSFGTALKLFDYSNLKISLAMILATTSMLYFTPKPTEFFTAIADKRTFENIKQSFLPMRLINAKQI